MIASLAAAGGWGNSNKFSIDFTIDVVTAGANVTVSPYTACGECPSCRRGRSNAVTLTVSMIPGTLNRQLTWPPGDSGPLADPTDDSILVSAAGPICDNVGVPRSRLR